MIDWEENVEKTCYYFRYEVDSFVSMFRVFENCFETNHKQIRQHPFAVK